jgi:predicted MFS family arabinose efflux permease
MPRCKKSCQNVKFVTFLMINCATFPHVLSSGDAMTEHIQPTTRPQTKEVSRPNWSAVFSVAFCVACLITVEFLPVSLLTPMAQDLGISEGVAGQSVTVTAFVAMFSSLFITQVIGTIDRRKVVILFSVLLTASCLLVSFANNFTLLLLGRACLGLGLGGFWAMSASLTMRLVPARTVPKALSVIFGAVSIALVIAAPLGSFLGGIIGWRNVFNAAAVMGVLCILWVWKRCHPCRVRRRITSRTCSACSGVRGAGGDERHLYVLCRAVCLLHLYPSRLYDHGRF